MGIDVLQYFGIIQPVSLKYCLCLFLLSCLLKFLLIKFMLDRITVFSCVCCILENSSGHFSGLLCLIFLSSVCCQINLSSFSF